MKKAIYKLTSGFIVFLFTLVSISSVSAADFTNESLQTSNTLYVSPTGSDANRCSLSAPCKTFERAMNVAVSGDLLIALEGTYSESLIISKSNITVEGLNAVIKASPHGIHVQSTAQNVTVRGFKVTGSESHAIFIQGQTVTVENNIVYRNVLENGTISNGGITCGDGSWGSAVKVGLGASNVAVRNNTIFDNCGEGIAITRGSYVIVENNTVYDNKSVNIYVDNSFEVEVINNNIYCSKVFPQGIALGEEYYSGWGSQLRSILVSGNEVKDCYTGIIAFSSYVDGTLTDVTISNNNIPTAQRRGISLDNTANLNVLVANNSYFNDIWVRSPQGVTLTNNTIVNQVINTSTSTFKSASNDGWVLESTENSNNGGKFNSTATTIIAGDNAADKQYRTILHFNTSALPDNAVIVSMYLKLKTQSVTGTNPFDTLGSLFVDIGTPAFGIADLEKTDFISAAKKVDAAIFNTNPVNGWHTATFNEQGYLYINRKGSTQFRLYFSMGDNDNLAADLIRFYSGNADSVNRPKLVIKYYVP